VKYLPDVQEDGSKVIIATHLRTMQTLTLLGNMKNHHQDSAVKEEAWCASGNQGDVTQMGDYHASRTFLRFVILRVASS